MTDKEEAILEQLPNTLFKISKKIGDKYPQNTLRTLRKMEEKGLCMQNDYKLWVPITNETIVHEKTRLKEYEEPCINRWLEEYEKFTSTNTDEEFETFAIEKLNFESLDDFFTNEKQKSIAFLWFHCFKNYNKDNS